VQCAGQPLFAVMVAVTVSNICSDIFHVMDNAIPSKFFRPGRDHVFYVMVALNLLLGLLQSCWFRKRLQKHLDLTGCFSCYLKIETLYSESCDLTD
jgi:hypothetical protein